MATCKMGKKGSISYLHILFTNQRAAQQKNEKYTNYYKICKNMLNSTTNKINAN